MPQVPDDIKARLAEFLPPEAGYNNPVDMIAAAPPESFRKALQILAEWDGIDAIIILYVPVLVTNPESIAAGIREAALDLPRQIPLLSVFLSSKGTPDSLKTDGLSLPSYPFPEDAARALAHAVRYGIWAETPEGVVPRFDDIRESEGKTLIAGVLASLQDADEDESRRMVRARERKVLVPNPGVQMELLAFGKKVMEPHLFRIAPGADSGGSYSHEGEEFIYVLQGKIEVWIDEIENYVLEAGDSLYFESTHAHRWQSLSQKETLLLWVNTPATF